MGRWWVVVGGGGIRRSATPGEGENPGDMAGAHNSICHSVPFASKFYVATSLLGALQAGTARKQVAVGRGTRWLDYTLQPKIGGISAENLGPPSG